MRLAPVHAPRRRDARGLGLLIAICGVLALGPAAAPDSALARAVHTRFTAAGRALIQHEAAHRGGHCAHHTRCKRRRRARPRSGANVPGRGHGAGASGQAPGGSASNSQPGSGDSSGQAGPSGHPSGEDGSTPRATVESGSPEGGGEEAEEGAAEEPGGGAPAAGGSAARPALALFSARSLFNEPLPASGVPRAPDSAQLVADFIRQVQAHYGHAVINTTAWSAPVYTVSADAPTTIVVPRNATCPRPEGVFEPFAQDVSAVPIPADAQAAAGSDEDMVIWQPATGHEWELWRAQREGGQWTACWGGELANARTGEGVFGAPLGVSASGLSILAGQIHLEELQAGQIDHALEVSLPDTAAERFVWPANRDDGESHAADAIPEGTRLRLQPGLDLAALHLNPVALALATAIQRYGMIVSDTAGAVAFEAQDPTPLLREGKPNPYGALLGEDPYDVLDAVPWGDLEVVSSEYRH